MQSSSKSDHEKAIEILKPKQITKASHGKHKQNDVTNNYF